MFEKITATAIGGLLFVYGIYCLIAPEQVATNIGYGLSNHEAKLEFLAMYGSVEIAIGFFGLLGVVNAQYLKPALLLFAITFALLLITRIAGYAILDDLGPYTQMATIFELLCSAFAYLAFRRLA